MSIRARVSRWQTALAIVAVVFAAGLTAAQQVSEPRVTMRGLYQALSTALLKSLDDDAFQDSASREEVLVSLRMLSANADRLERHAKELGPSYDYLRRSLAKDCRDAAARFVRGDYIATQFVLMKLTENCVACHSRQPLGQPFDLGQDFVEDTRVQSLPPEDRLQLEIATRQFDRAMETCEQVLLSSETVPEYIAVTGIFEAYLKLAVRVEENTDRSISSLRAFAERPDLSSYIGNLAEAWVDALERLEDDRKRDSDLDTARELIHEAQALNRFPSDRRGLVQLIAASSRIHDYLTPEPSDKLSVSEAYYLLGLTESHISRSYWISETQFFLERSVRVAPKSESAREAYDLLEAYTAAAYTGSGGVSLPPDTRAHLDELKRLIE
jgi:tetratricopeptide (TPR) repeat protein